MQILIKRKNFSIEKYFHKIYLKENKKRLFEILYYWQVFDFFKIFIIRKLEYPFKEMVILFGYYPQIDKFLQEQENVSNFHQ
jgi:hypothetical protein